MASGAVLAVRRPHLWWLAGRWWVLVGCGSSGPPVRLSLALWAGPDLPPTSGCNRGWGWGSGASRGTVWGAGGVLARTEGLLRRLPFVLLGVTPRARPVIYGQGHPLPPRKRQVQPLARDPKAEPWGDLLAVPFHQSPPPAHHHCPLGGTTPHAPGRHGLAWVMSCPEQLSGHVRAKGSLESVSCLLVSWKEMDPGVSQSRPRGGKLCPLLGFLGVQGAALGRWGEIKTPGFPRAAVATWPRSSGGPIVGQDGCTGDQ